MYRMSAKEEKFALYIFEGMTQIEAYEKAGYSTKCKKEYVYNLACRKANSVKIMDRVDELQKKAEEKSIATVIERKKILSEIARGNIIDYVTCGPDGDWITVDEKSPNQAALKEVTTITKYDKDGDNPRVVTEIKLHNPVQAIAELNKMERIGANDDKNTINIEAINILNLEQKLEKLSDDELRKIAYGDNT